jgi:predicted component of type VI protein secretion system
MPAQLMALDNSASILLDKPIMLVGRHPECDIQIDSRKISRRHCCIAQVSDYLVIRDLGSTNGIRINGTRVQEGKLSAGDEVTIGNNRYQVSWDSMVAAPPHKQPPRNREDKPSRPRVLADELLEECDEPVPLVEPDDEAEEEPLVPRTPPSPILPPSPPPLAAKEVSHILPEDLELAPRSDAGPRNDPGPAPSA